MTEITIQDKPIGEGQPTYIVAEIGFNHEGKVDLGVDMIRAAARVGADAVKFQTFKAAELTLRNWEHFDLIKHGELDLEGHKTLAATAAEEGVAFLSTPFSPWAVDLLEEIGVPAYKIASMDVTNLPLLRLVAGTGKPVVLSTGMATLTEVAEAIETLHAAGDGGICLLHCISHYPTEPKNAHLRTMDQLAESFGLPVGFSDHLLGNAVAVAAVARGACMVEKHFTTDKTLPGPDHKLSADPNDLDGMVADIRAVEVALGRAAADENRPDRDNAAAARRGLYAASDIPMGTVITAEHVKCVRPERGLPPKDLDRILGRETRVHIEEESPFTADQF